MNKQPDGSHPPEETNKKTENNKQINNVCVIEPPEHVINHPYKAGNAIQGTPPPSRPYPILQHPGNLGKPETKPANKILCIITNCVSESEPDVNNNNNKSEVSQYPNRPRDLSVTIVESKSECMHCLCGTDPS